MIYLIALFCFVLTFCGLCIGLLFKRPGIKGSCGGHEGIGQKMSCTSCSCSGEGPNDSQSVKAVTLLS